MIKIALFLFVFIIPIMGLSQSARKINKALKSEYAVQLQAYDSLMQVNDSVTTVLEVLQVKLNNSYTSLYNQRKTLNKLKNDAVNMYRYLIFLDKTISLDFSYDSLKSIRNSYRINSSYSLLYNKVKRIPRQAYFVLLDDASIKDQNVALDSVSREKKTQLASLRQSNLERVELINKMFIMLHDFELIASSMDSLQAVLIKKTTYLEDKKTDLFAKRKQSFLETGEFVGPVVDDWEGDNPNGYYPIPFYMQEDSGDFDFWIIEEKVVTEPIRFVEKKDYSIFSYTDESAYFNGDLKQYLAENIVYPQRALELGLQGKCYLQFNVSSFGNISNVHVMRSVPDCKECDDEAVRVVKGMPNWIPGKINGKAVNSTFNLPVSFKLPTQ